MFYRLFFLCFLLFLVSCEKSSDAVVLQVGESRLTRSELLKEIPEWDSLPNEAQMQYLTKYVEEELLYLAALEQKIDLQESVARKMEQVKRKILVSELLENLTDTLSVSSDEVKNFYTANPSLFINGRYLWSVAILSYPNWKAGDSYFRSKKKESFFKVPAADYRLKKVTVLDSLTESPDSCLVPDLRAAEVGKLTGFKVCNRELRSFVVLSMEDSAAVRPFESVKDDAAILVFNEKRKKIIEDYNKNLKQKVPVF